MPNINSGLFLSCFKRRTFYN